VKKSEPDNIREKASRIISGKNNPEDIPKKQSRGYPGKIIWVSARLEELAGTCKRTPQKARKNC
jgi:hypothetical protein